MLTPAQEGMVALAMLINIGQYMALRDACSEEERPWFEARVNEQLQSDRQELTALLEGVPDAGQDEMEDP